MTPGTPITLPQLSKTQCATENLGSNLQVLFDAAGIKGKARCEGWQAFQQDYSH